MHSLWANGTELSHLTLVQDGHPAATIVAPNDGRLAVQLAVAELNHYIEKMTGTRLPIADDKMPVEGPRVLVGESEATRALGLTNNQLSRQEYLVETQPNLLILMGRDSSKTGKLNYKVKGVWDGFNYFTPLGTVYAVYDFLERCCGIRWYLPTEIGEVVPRRVTLTVSPVKIRRKPWTKYRQIWPQRKMPARLYQWDMSDSGELKNVRELSKREVMLFWLRQRIGGEYFKCNHSFYTWDKRFRHSHPEYFAKLKRIRLPTLKKKQTRQLNYASEAVVEQVVKDILACRQGQWQDENGIPRFGRGGRNVFPLVPMDNKRWPRDSESQKLLLTNPTRAIGSFNNNRASFYVFQFVVKVAERIAKLDPDVIISALAYGDYYFPPENIAFPDNVAIMVCKQQVKKGSIRRDDAYYASLREWRQKVKKLYIWEYYNFPQFRQMNVFPGLVPRRIGKDMKVLYELGIDGEFIEINTAKGFPPLEGWLVNPAMQHINYYFTLKLLDTMERSVEELLDEYYRLFYGPAEEPMRKFFTTIEDIYTNEDYSRTGTDRRKKKPGRLNDRRSWTVYCPPEQLNQFADLIAQAKEEARDKPPYEARVELMDKAIFQFMKTSSERYHRRTKK